MPSITQWSALGGLGKAAGQSLQELLANRLAEQKRQDLLAELEQKREQERLEREALEQHRRTIEAQGDRTYAHTERTYTEGAPLRLLNTQKLQADLAAKAKEDAEVAESVAAMQDPGFDQLPLAQRQYHYAKATGGQTPSAGMLETPAERTARLQEAEDIQTAGRIREIQATPRNPPPDPNAPPKPTDREQAIPAELSEILTGLAQHAPSLEVARQFIEQNKLRIRADFPTTDFIVVDEKLASYFKTRPAKGRTGIEAITEALSGAPPAPTYTYPGKRGTPAPAPGVTPPTPPAVADPTMEILRQRGLVQ